MCVCSCCDLVQRLDVHEALDEVGALHLGELRVEGVLRLAGDEQTHQAGASDRLVHHVLQTCSHKQTRAFSVK